MCMALYVATDQAIGITEWSRASALFGDELTRQQSRVLTQFTKPVVRFVGVVGPWACSCAFPSILDDTSDARGQQLIQELRALLMSEVAKGRDVELFYCWMDDEADEPERRVVTTPEQIATESVPLETSTLYLVRRAAEQGDEADEAFGGTRVR